MSKPNVFNWRPKFREPQSITLKDDVNGTEQEFKFTFWTLTDPEEMRAMQDSQELIKRYIGTEDNEEEPVDFSPIGGAPVDLTENAITYACLLVAAQPPFVKPEDRWTNEEMIALRARASKPFRTALNKFFTQVNGRAVKAKVPEALSLNPTGVGTSESSEPACEGTSDTPSSTNLPLPSSGVSTTGSDGLAAVLMAAEAQRAEADRRMGLEPASMAQG